MIPSSRNIADRRSKKHTLNTGMQMPAIGLGTWRSKPHEVQHAVEVALARGYRHIDTAFAYGNEKEVGAGIKASGVPRGDIWLTTKLDNPWHQRVAEAIDKSLKNLGTPYVDLYLMHWPCSTDPADSKKHLEGWDFVDTWREMQKLLGTGKVRNIGVSNMGIRNLEKLLSHESCKVGRLATLLTTTALTDLQRRSPRSTRLSCTRLTRRLSSWLTTPPRASKPRRTPPSAAMGRPCIPTRQFSPLPRRRTAVHNRCY